VDVGGPLALEGGEEHVTPVARRQFAGRRLALQGFHLVLEAVQFRLRQEPRRYGIAVTGESGDRLFGAEGDGHSTSKRSG